jgi:EmrB/QacA subfamily drug resistance transporter
MEILDGTIVTTAAPAIAESLGVRTTAISLVITAYIVTIAVLIPLSGWAAMRWGSRRVFLAAIAVFTVASIACAASRTLTELVAARILQGVGGAMMVPVGRTVVLSGTAKTDLMRMTAYLVWPALAAPVVAPLLGGVITTAVSWHWIFLLNVPLGVVAFAAALRLIEGEPAEAPPRLDRFGVLLTCIGLGGLTYTAQLISESTGGLAVVVAVGGVSTAFLAIAIRHLLRTAFPLVDLRTLRIPTFGASIRGSSVFMLAVAAIPFLLPLLFQTQFGWSPVKSGALVLFVFAGNLAIKPATTYIYGRFGFRTVIAVSTASLALTLVAMALLTADTPLVLIAALGVVSGVARSIGFTGYTTLAFTDVPDDRMRDANVVYATSFQLMFGLGVAVAAIALRAGDVLLGDADPRTPYIFAFVALAAVTLVATAGALRMPAGAGDVLRPSAGS